MRYDPAMSETHTPHRPIRVADELWERFGKATGERNRAQVLREFMAWYTRTPKAKLPTRPPAGR